MRDCGGDVVAVDHAGVIHLCADDERLRAEPLFGSFDEFVIALQPVPPDVVQERFDVGKELMRLGDLERAEACFRETWASEPHASKAVWLADCLAERGDDEAEWWYRESLRLNPRHSKTAMRFAEYLVSREKPREAVEVARGILEYNAGFGPAVRLLAEFGEA